MSIALLYPVLLQAFSIVVTAANSSNVTLIGIIGDYRVAISSFELIDYHRLDPYAPTPQPRKLMVSVYAPVPPHVHCTPGATTPYMPSVVAAFEDAIYAPAGVPNGSFFRPQLPVCRNDSSAVRYRHDSADRFPLVLFSPGLGDSCLLSGAMVEAVASAGFAVVAVDHP